MVNETMNNGGHIHKASSQAVRDIRAKDDIVDAAWRSFGTERDKKSPAAEEESKNMGVVETRSEDSMVVVYSMSVTKH